MRETETETESFWVRSAIFFKKEWKGGFSSMRLGTIPPEWNDLLIPEFFFVGGKRQTLVS